MFYTSIGKNNSDDRIFLWLNNFLKIKTLLFTAILICLYSGFAISQSSSAGEKWVGTWSTALQLVETQNNPPSPGLSNNTIRQIVHVSIGGDSLRVSFSNIFSTHPVTIQEAHIAVSTGSDSIDTATDKIIYFNGSTQYTMQPGAAVVSDPFHFSLKPLSNVAITIYFGSTSSDVTGHPGSRTTSYILTGDNVAKANFSGAVTTEHWYVINTIDVVAPDTAHAVAILGNSITDGRGSGTNKQDRWPDELSRRFQANPATQQVAVLNEGIGGNAVLSGGLGPTALSRFQRDIIDQSGVKWLIIFEGINDIGGSSGSGVGNNLINAYKQMIHTAHVNGIFVYGATLMPMKGSQYYSASHETEREIVNNWVRTSGAFDAVIDLDKAVRDPADTLSLLPTYDSGDHLHPSEEGHRALAEAVDLSLFTGNDTLNYVDNSKTIYFEAECGTVGSSWNILSDPQASNGKYVTVKTGVQSLNSAPTGNESYVIIPFTIDSAGDYTVFGRMNCPSSNDDSYWVKMDDGDFQMDNGLGTSGWEWKQLNSYTLAQGNHTLTIGYREDGALLDKIGISNSVFAPTGMGGEAENICTPTEVINSKELPHTYALGQNYPNPFNPVTTIKFSIPRYSYVTLKVFNALGKEVAVLVNGMKQPGNYSITFNGSGLASGVYVYQLKSGNFVDNKKFVLLK